MGFGKWIAGALGWAMFGPIGGILGYYFASGKSTGSIGKPLLPSFFQHQTIYINPSTLGFILTSTPVRHQIKYNSQYIVIFLHFSFISISFA